MKVGLCGFTMAMEDYPLHFPVVEVQQTFYDPPADATLRRWVEAMPRGFEFTLKAWQLVTHDAASPTYRRLKRPLDRAGCGSFRDTPVVHEAWRQTLRCRDVLGATAILFQCPARFRPEPENLDRLRRFFERVERPRGVKLLWEPRGPAWTERLELARRLADELGLVHVVDPFVDPPPAQAPATSYFRLHGTTGARHVYTDAELRRLRAMVPRTGEVYVMFNNMPRVRDAKRFLEQARRARPP
jgi:uncharacterized protein YecE (DUF72 family)